MRPFFKISKVTFHLRREVMWSRRSWEGWGHEVLKTLARFCYFSLLLGRRLQLGFSLAGLQDIT